MKNIPLLLGTIFGTLILVLGVAFFFSNSSTPVTDQAPIDPALLVGEAPHIYGPEDAQITVVEFSDFQCPACRATAPFIKDIADQYPEDVRVIYRHFPLSSIHPYAQFAAEASEVAATQGKFWEYHDILFESFDEWTKLKSVEEVQEALVRYAGELGIDTAEFQEKILSREQQDAVLSDVSAGNSFNVNATPTLFVNGQRLSAPNQLPQLIEALLVTSKDATSSATQGEASESGEVVNPEVVPNQ